MLHDYNVKLPNFTFCRGRELTATTLFHFLNFDAVLENQSTPKKFANIWLIKRDEISAVNFEAVQIHFLSNVFVAVVVNSVNSLLIELIFIIFSCQFIMIISKLQNSQLVRLLPVAILIHVMFHLKYIFHYPWQTLQGQRMIKVLLLLLLLLLLLTSKRIVQLLSS